MIKSELKIGGYYAYRENPRRRGTPVQRVDLEAWQGKGTWRIRYLDPPHRGQQIDARSNNLLVPWDERGAFLADEERLLKVLEASAVDRATWRESSVELAANHIFVAAGIGDWTLYPQGDNAGDVRMPVAAARRMLKRAKLDSDPLQLDKLAFIDRHDVLHVPFRAGMRLVRAFARSEPKTVLTYVRSEEREWETKHKEEGKDYMEDLMEEWRAGWSLAKQWVSEESKPRQSTATSTKDTGLRESLRRLWDKIAEIEQRRTIEHQQLKELLDEVTRKLQISHDREA